MKRFPMFSFMAATLVFFSVFQLTAPARADFNHDVKVLVDGREVGFPDQKPFIDSLAGRAYVPLRFVSEALGGAVDWDQETRTAGVNKSGTRVLMQVGSKSPTVDGQVRVIDAAALLINGRTVVPLRFIGECLGAAVEWDAENRIVRITTPAPNPNVPPGYKVTSMGYVIPENTKLEFEDKVVDVNFTVMIILPRGDLETQFQQAEDALASVHGREVAKEVVNYARQKTIYELELEKTFYQKIRVCSDWNGPRIYIEVWR